MSFPAVAERVDQVERRHLASEQIVGGDIKVMDVRDAHLQRISGHQSEVWAPGYKGAPHALKESACGRKLVDCALLGGVEHEPNDALHERIGQVKYREGRAVAACALLRARVSHQTPSGHRRIWG